jgi:Tfp pilus assembly protein PilV
MKISAHDNFGTRTPTPLANRSGRLRPLAAFTLLEVMIAMGIFFMCIFAILEVVATNLRGARSLQNPPVDVSLLIDDLYQTNKLQEGTDSGDFGDLFPGYAWSSETTQVATNGLFKVEFLVTHRAAGDNTETHMSVLLWRPDSPQKLP